MTYFAKVISGGKVVIPADLRRELGIKEGDSLVFTRGKSGEVSISTFDQVVRDSRKLARDIFGANYTVDQFIAENRTDWGAE